LIREVVSTHWEHHSLIVGLVAILVVILAPKGLVGLWRTALEHLEHDRGPKPVSQTLRVEP
jgi:branched-chain amino acid transport system permease protein